MGIVSHIKNFLEYSIIFPLLKLLLAKANQTNRSILFINTGQIGDLVVSSIILENPDTFSEYDEIKFVIREQYMGLFADGSSKLEFIEYNYLKYKYSFLYKVIFLRYLRSFGFEKCFNLTTARGIINDELTLLSGAKEKYCLNTNWRYLGKYLGNKLDNKYTQIIAPDIINEYNKHYEVLKFLSEKKGNEIHFKNKYTFKINEHFQLKEKILYYNSIVIAPFSSERNRDWPKEYFTELLRLLSQKYEIFLIGTKHQRDDLNELKSNISNVSILAGGLELSEIPSFLAEARLFIGLDSGITHIALKLGIPIIAIIGGGNYGRFFPFKESNIVRYLFYKMDCFGCDWECTLERKFCIEHLSVNEIYKTAIELLQVS